MFPDHNINLNSASLIEKEARYFHRKFKEALFIQKTKNNMNKDIGMPIDPLWTNLLLPITPDAREIPRRWNQH